MPRCGISRSAARQSLAQFIGKESNQLEEVAEGSVPDAGDVYTEYPDPRRDEWETKVLPLLKKVSAKEIVQMTGISRRGVQRIRNGQTSPTTKHRKLLKAFATGRLGGAAKTARKHKQNLSGAKHQS